MTLAPLASEIDSLLLGEEDDDVVEEGGDCGEGSAANRLDKTRKNDSGPAPFVFNWAEAPANNPHGKCVSLMSKKRRYLAYEPSRIANYSVAVSLPQLYSHLASL